MFKKIVILESVSACVILMCYKKRQELPENVLDNCPNVWELQLKSD
jgi:hypothetical protein